jgi:hypothetical protein
MEQKMISGHGHFLKWCKENLAGRGLSERSAQRYMGFANALQPKLASVANFDFPQLRETNGSNGALPESALDTISEAIHEIANGQTFTEMYRDLGLIPDKKKQQHTPQKITAEEAEAQRRATALQFIDALDADLANAASNAELQAIIETKRFKESLDRALTYTSAIRKLIKDRGGVKKDKKPKAKKVREVMSEEQRAEIAKAAPRTLGPRKSERSQVT